jgi:hypothetical protein
MPNADDIRWFKQQFQTTIEAALTQTPFDVDMIAAIACQETGYIWQRLRKKPLTLAQITALCVGDTIDAKAGGGGRKAFPKNKAALLAKPDGQAMFDIARKALVEMARHVPGHEQSVANPNKFCRGYGVFQYDLQFFLTNPRYFLEKRYERFDQTLHRCIDELRSAIDKLHWQAKTSLTDYEMASIAIVYNTGRFTPSKGLKQGHFNGTRYYGEEIFDFIRLSRTVAIGDGEAALRRPPPGRALIPPPRRVTATGPPLEVDTRISTLRLRSYPAVSSPRTANVIAELPDGHKVRAITGTRIRGFIEVETSLNGALFRGFASAKFLRPAAADAEVAVLTPAATAPETGIVAVYMPRTAGLVTRRTGIAGAHSLNEPGQPGRAGATANELRTELAAIIEWLAVDKTAHKRYQPRQGLTFCNIYAHDYCHLAGVYLPRVWWTQKAIADLAQGIAVEPLYEDTISEQSANNLFRWLRDFGVRFGWRQAATLSELQQEANQGAIGLIVARRREDGRSGHIVMVVPETNERRARRNTAGEVIAPLQSQAGVSNFRYGTGRRNWWKGEQFAESSFWLHA